jgi:thermitase
MKSIVTLFAIALVIAFSATTSFSKDTLFQYLIKFKNHPDASKNKLELVDFGLKLKEHIGPNKQIYVYTAPLELSQQALSSLNTRNGIDWIEPDYQIQIPMPVESTQKKSPALSLSEPYHHQILETKKAHKALKDGKEIIVAVLDTGIESTHPNLKNHMWTNSGEIAGNGIDDDKNGFIDDVHGYDFYNNQSSAEDDNGHGTHCAGLIGAYPTDARDVFGVMPKVKLMSLKIFNQYGQGKLSTAIKAVLYAVRNGAVILNNSYGSPNPNKSLRLAFKAAEKLGVIAVSAAGNHKNNNDTRGEFPANFDLPNIISVGSTDAKDTHSSFSNFGALSVDLSAPGDQILSTHLHGKLKSLSGTSMSTPLVAGVLGLVWSKDPSQTYREVIQKVLNGSDKLDLLFGKNYNLARVNAYNSVKEKKIKNLYPLPEKKWKEESLDIQSDHPYLNNSRASYIVEKSGAKYIKLNFDKIHMESGYDFLEIINSKGVIVHKLNGPFKDDLSLIIPGDKLTLQIDSDSSQTEYGFKISNFSWGK